MVYASTTETYDNFEYNYKKLWERKYQYGNWGPFLHLTQDINHIFDESVFPYIADRSDAQYYYLLYQADGTPGVALNGDHDYQENRIMVAQVEKQWIGVEEIASNPLDVLECYPNPFRDQATLSVNLLQPSLLKMEVMDRLGHVVLTLDRGDVAKGTYYFRIDRGDLPSGIYFYRVSAGQHVMTKKLIIL